MGDFLTVAFFLAGFAFFVGLAVALFFVLFAGLGVGFFAEGFFFGDFFAGAFLAVAFFLADFLAAFVFAFFAGAFFADFFLVDFFADAFGFFLPPEKISSQLSENCCVLPTRTTLIVGLLRKYRVSSCEL